MNEYFNPDEDYIVIKNPDKELRADILRKIQKNNGYCPSRFERTPETKCHCKNFRERGECICGLFLKFYCMDVTGGA
jgi:ferredoxin-thioredoxin reductase catalytic subunit